MRVRLITLALSLLVGCGGQHDLLVDLRTDLIPRLEVDRATVSLDGDAAVDAALDVDAAGLLAGARIAELTGLSTGTHSVVVELFLGAETVARRPLLVDVTSDLVVTVVVTRDCRAVECGDAEACLRGGCVDARCSPEFSDLCPAAECATAADCALPDTCGQARCEAGTCFFTDDGSCGIDAFCDPSVGCRDTGDPWTDPWLVASDANRLLLAGGYVGALRVDGEPLPAASPGMLLQARDSTGSLLWTRTFSGGAVFPEALSAGPGDRFAVAGVMRSPDALPGLSLGGIPGEPATFVGVFDATTGDPVWAVRNVGGLYTSAKAVAMGAGGEVYAAFTYQSEVTVGDVTLPAPAGGTYTAIFAYDASGRVRWALVDEGARTSGIAPTATGFYVTGGVDQTADVGGTIVTGVGVDAYIGHVRDDGDSFAVEWITSFGGGPNAAVGAVAVDGAGGAWIVGRISTQASAGRVGEATHLGQGGYDGFVASFGPDGTFGTASFFGGTEGDVARSVVVDGTSVQFTGWAAPPLTVDPFGLAPLPSPRALRATLDIGTGAVSGRVIPVGDRGWSIANVPATPGSVCVVGRADPSRDDALVRGRSRSVFLDCGP